MSASAKHVVVVGSGFAGLNAAQRLARCRAVRVTIVDRNNYHLFQPLLYQVAMAGLSPADIAAPIRSLFAGRGNVATLQGQVTHVDLASNRIETDFGVLDYDYLVLACGMRPSYFGHSDWEQYAPSLKTVPQATEIRRRLLTAFEQAERTRDPASCRRLLTFVVIGGGPTGVELAGAIGEMSRYTLARDFRQIDATRTRVMLLEGGDRILPSFDESQSQRAARDLERLGVQVWTNSRVTQIDADGVEVGEERIEAATVLWAAGVEAVSLPGLEACETDRQGRLLVEDDLRLRGQQHVFVAGDQARIASLEAPLPGTAPVAMQQGNYLAQRIEDDVAGRATVPFRFVDKGQMATIGRRSAVAEIGSWRLSGSIAWLAWLVVHIYFLVGFRNRLFVILNWAWSYVTFRRGARLIIDRRWRSLPAGEESPPTP